MIKRNKLKKMRSRDLKKKESMKNKLNGYQLNKHNKKESSKFKSLLSSK
jgi:hypothetical protein